MSASRAATKIIRAVHASDGAGVKLRRSIGSPHLRNLDPFLMLDAFGTENPDDYIAGFPSHPHRGFETVTYMLEGSMEHRDSVGNTGHLTSGSVQWMTAGRGIVHSEMPQQEEGRMAGFQLWVNLPAARKMTDPRYQDIPPEDIPVVEDDDGRVKVIAGSFGGVTGPVGGVDTDPTMLDLELAAGAERTLALTPGYTAFLYVFEGKAHIPGVKGEVPPHHLIVLGDGDAVTVGGAEDGTRILLLSGRPIGEPIVQYGPFVMNTEDEIRQAITDYQTGRFVA